MFNLHFKERNLVTKMAKADLIAKKVLFTLLLKTLCFISFNINLLTPEKYDLK